MVVPSGKVEIRMMQSMKYAWHGQYGNEDGLSEHSVKGELVWTAVYRSLARWYLAEFIQVESNRLNEIVTQYHVMFACRA